MRAPFNSFDRESSYYLGAGHDDVDARPAEVNVLVILASRNEGASCRGIRPSVMISSRELFEVASSGGDASWPLAPKVLESLFAAIAGRLLGKSG